MVALLASTGLAQETQWLTDKAKAIEQARAQNRPILIDFTGSDWCGWCIRMKKDSLDTKEFSDYAAKNLVLLEVDFPHSKEQSEELKSQNKALKDQYGVRGYPTFLLIDKDGKELGKQVGYVKGGPAAFIEKLESFKK